jgi:Flp pilus assembly protein TadD
VSHRGFQPYAIEPHPNEELLLRLGFCQVASGKLIAGRDTYRGLVQLHPGSFRGHYNLGNVLSELGDRAGAGAAYRQALTVNPAYEPARVALSGLP